MKLWQKDVNLNRDIEKFTVGDDHIYDLVLAKYDVLGSMAHARMLRDTNLLNNEEWKVIDAGLKKIYEKVKGNEFRIEDGVEDIHSQVEKLLTEITGDPGKKIHTGRSRNDQVLLDLRLYFRDEIITLSDSLMNLSEQLIDLGEKHSDVFMPGYTHLQAAMPSSFGLWFGAYAECIAEDVELFHSVFHIINRNPLGSAAGYGSSFPINRQITTSLLGFDAMNVNSIAAQMGRGRTERLLSSVLAQAADTLGRMASEICLYMGQDFGFFKFPDELTTGSSIMPHKKNPDVFELIRGKCNLVKALFPEMMMISSNLPSGYNRDYQLYKGRMIWGLTTFKECADMMNFMIRQVVINRELKTQEKYKYIFSVELVNEYVKNGMSFREAYKKVSEIIESGKFSIPAISQYTHEGSTGNPGNKTISLKLAESREFFHARSVLIKSKYDQLITGE
jgi:argininosuccinate lyase